LKWAHSTVGVKAFGFGFSPADNSLTSPMMGPVENMGYSAKGLQYINRTKDLLRHSDISSKKAEITEDENQELTSKTFWKDTPIDTSDTICLMTDNHYRLLFEDAHEFAALTQTVLEWSDFNGRPFAFCDIREEPFFDIVVRRLTMAGKRVAVYDGVKLNEGIFEQIGIYEGHKNPGTAYSTSIASVGISSVDDCTAAVVCFDLSNDTLKITEVNAAYLQDELKRMDPKLTIFDSRFEHVFGPQFTTDFKKKYGHSFHDFECSADTDIERCFREEGKQIRECLMSFSSNEQIALNNLIEYRELAKHELSKKLPTPGRAYADDKMQVDESALRFLEVFELDKGRNKTSETLFDAINLTKTVQGEFLLKGWLKNPSADLWYIQKVQNVVETFINDLCLRKKISFSW
jgi:DNA mismatch repair ATPase MutS